MFPWGACLGPMERMGTNSTILPSWLGHKHCESRFLNLCKSKTHQKIMKVSMVTRHGTYMSWNFFIQFGPSFITNLLQTGASHQNPRGLDRETCPPYGQNDNHSLFLPSIFFYRQHGTTGDSR